MRAAQQPADLPPPSAGLTGPPPAAAAFIEQEGATVSEFYRQVREAHEENENSSRALFGQILAAIADYDVFMAMLTDMRAEVDKEESRAEAKGK